MAKSNSKSRKDSKGRVLHKGECERKKYNDYVYQYYDMNHQRRSLYASDLIQLRKKEALVQVDIFDGVDTFSVKSMEFNDAFDRYIERQKPYLNIDTYNTYCVRYDLYVRNGFGTRKIGSIKNSDVKSFYNSLITGKGLKVSTVNNVNTLIHPVFAMLVQDQLIRTNPSDGVMKKIRTAFNESPVRKCALGLEQQRDFIRYVEMNPRWKEWIPLIIVLLGTGCRIGEALALRWVDIDMQNHHVHIRHAVKYRKNPKTGHCEMHISEPKTENGVRNIPMIEDVYKAFELQKQYQKRYENVVEIDGYTGFIFTNKGKRIYLPTSVYRTINDISKEYNQQEEREALQEGRTPNLLPNLGCHSMRHTFCTRFCENESNLKVVQEIMGHSNIATTMNIYAEVMEEKKREAMDNFEKSMKIM